MYRYLTRIIFVVALFLRLFLCWENPPDNSFDDHYGPIELILQTGEIPPKDACFQCYQPPVFYYSSAIVAKVLISLGVTDNHVIEKTLQFLNCFYAILTLLVTYLILKRMNLSEWSRLLTFCTICFLPRHIFMSVMHSNDSLAYLGISLCVYLLLVTINRKLSWPFAGLLGITLTLTIFVKYTAFLLLPMVAAPLVTIIIVRSTIPRSKSVTAFLLVLLIPLIVLGIYMTSNYRNYGYILPWNDTMVNTSVVQPQDPEGISFTSFTPWQYIKEPILIPGQMHSFWTLIYCGMWVDSEPRFIDIIDRSASWPMYFNWLTGKGAFPASPIPISIFTRILSSGLLICGMLPLVLIIAGFARCLYNTRSTQTDSGVVCQAFPIMLVFNVIGISVLTLKAPVYSSMKASYFLNSIPALSVFIALGLQRVENIIWAKRVVTIVCCTIALLTTAYIIRICLALLAL
jgi:4-amino-4-deoxy-L-arabinose transferase-like glycosyltransferase